MVHNLPTQGCVIKLVQIAHSARSVPAVGKSSVSEREEWNSIEIGPVVGRVSDDPWVIIRMYQKRLSIGRVYLRRTRFSSFPSWNDVHLHVLEALRLIRGLGKKACQR
jgi:hypothetical protein